MFLEYLFFVAEKRELFQLIRASRKVTSHFYVGELNNKKYGIYITGVGKKAVSLSLKNLNGLNSASLCHYVTSLSACGERTLATLQVFLRLRRKMPVGQIEAKKVKDIIAGLGNECRITAKLYINLGNTGALKNYFPGTIVEIGTVFGKNGKSSFVLNKYSHFNLISVNSNQNKKKLLEQYKDIDVVDMELFAIANKIQHVPLIAYKIILDNPNTNPKNIINKIQLNWQIHLNSIKLSNFIIKKFFYLSF